jgi:UDP-N-acetylglucosamine 2-epimerase (non-hydrolysing)
MNVLCVVAARPNFMKVKPVVDALELRGAEVTLVHTGQHYDPALSDVFFEELGLRAPDLHLGVGSGTHAQQTAEVMVALEPVVAELAPEVMVVVGDVNSTMAAALVAAKAGVRLAHVEAGLRSGDRSMPEEINRIVTDRLSDVLLAPSPDAVANLRAEGRSPADIHLVGNVMIDTLLANLDRALDPNRFARFAVEEGGFALVTLHRPGNVDDPDVLAGLLEALAVVSEQLPVLFPVHPRTRPLVDELGVAPGVRLLEPLGYLDFVGLEARAAVVLTDSGGVQEETTVLGVPCLTLRDTTERPITVEEGTNRVVGRDPRVIVQEVQRVLHEGVRARRPALWDGRAAARIAEVLLANRP